jgi:hypothetical protein
MTELWSAGGAIPELMFRQAYIILGAFVLGFVLLEAVYLVALAVVVTRWKANRNRPRGAPQVSSDEQGQPHTSKLHRYAVATPR